MRLIYERLKVCKFSSQHTPKLITISLQVVVEPTGALAFAAVRSGKFRELGICGPVAVVISGGNLDLSVPLPWME